VYVEQVQYSNLKAKCAINGTSVSEWFRNAADDFLNSKKIIPEKTEDKTSPGAPQVATPFVEEEFHECSWDKTFNCRSPGVIQIRGKWYCIVHAKEV